MLQKAGVFNILTCKCASRHSGVQFFDIKPPKSGPYPSVFPHFDLKMRRATAACHFWTSYLPKWLRNCGVLCILTLECASRHSRVPCLNIGTSKIGPRLWCFVQFDLQMCFAPQRRAIFHLSARTASAAPAALARLLFEHQEPRIIEKTQRFAASLTFFARLPSF